MPASDAEEATFVRVATVARAHGLRGQVVVDIDPTMAELVTPGLAVRLEKTSGGSCDSSVTSARALGRRMVWGLAALEDRTAAEAWAGAAVFVSKSALPATGADEYFDFELLGAEVFDTAGTQLGTVRELIVTGANDVLVADGLRGEILIPVTRRAIVEIDRAGRRIVVDSRALVYGNDGEAP
jgi:16S rRNA processing protein RimM